VPGPAPSGTCHEGNLGNRVAAGAGVARRERDLAQRDGNRQAARTVHLDRSSPPGCSRRGRAVPDATERPVLEQRRCAARPAAGTRTPLLKRPAGTRAGSREIVRRRARRRRSAACRRTAEEVLASGVSASWPVALAGNTVAKAWLPSADATRTWPTLRGRGERRGRICAVTAPPELLLTTQNPEKQAGHGRPFRPMHHRRATPRAGRAAVEHGARPSGAAMANSESGEPPRPRIP